MARFKYTSMSLDGTCSTQERDIENLGVLKQELERQRRILVSVEPIKAGGRFGWRGTVSPRIVTSFLRELSLILRSGMPLAEALDLAAQDAQSSLSGAVTTLRRQLVSGASFVQALEQQPGIFTPDVVAMARVGEATGDLGGVFRALADERARSHALMDKVNGAIRYPAFLIFMATSVLLFFMLHVIPQFSGLFSEQKKPPSGLAAAVFDLSNWLVANQTNVMIGALLVLLGILLLSRVPAAKKIVVRGFSGLPVIGGLFLMRRSALLLSNMSVLLGRGVPLVEALQVLEDLFGSDTKDDFAKLKDIVRQGGRLNEALTAIRILPALAVRMLKIGEETGELAKTSGEAGQLYMEKLEKRLTQVTGMIGPAAIIFIAGMIGTMMAAVMTAILSVNEMAM
jgi:general secretion pathway protein F